MCVCVCKFQNDKTQTQALPKMPGHPADQSQNLQFMLCCSAEQEAAGNPKYNYGLGHAGQQKKNEARVVESAKIAESENAHTIHY